MIRGRVLGGEGNSVAGAKLEIRALDIIGRNARNHSASGE